LSSYIPSLLAKPINGFLQAAKQKIGINTIDKYGFHPGGRKILDYIKDELKVTHGDVAVSYEVLRKYGNMSSPTVLFVLKEIIESLKNDETVFSAAFGPGLSMESMITRGV
jgi:alpha-pyrone synthase